MRNFFQHTVLFVTVLCLVGIGCHAADSIKGPFDAVSVGEVLTAACRLYGTATDDASGKALSASNDDYSAVAAYAVEKGLITADSYSSYTKSVTRLEAIRILYPVLADDKYAFINDILKISDLSAVSSDYPAALAFCRAGILSLDAGGNLKPFEKLTQKELSAMVSRMSVPSRRIGYTVTTKDTRKQAFRVSVTSSLNGSKEGLQSGWEFDNRAGRLKTTLAGNTVLTDFMTDEKSRMIRYFERMTDDKIELRTQVSYSYGFDGNVLEFCDEDGTPAYRLVTHDGAFCIEGADGSYTPIYTPKHALSSTFTFRIELDLAKGMSVTAINNVNCGTHPLIGDAVRYFAYSTTDESKNITQMYASYINANYFVNENLTMTSSIPYDMKATGSTSVKSGEFLLPSASSLSKSFEPTSGKISFNFNAFFPDGSNSVTFALTSNGTTVAKFSVTDDQLYANGVKVGDKLVYKELTDKLWYKMRIEADPDTGSADFKVNGKVIGTVPFLAQADSFDGILFENNGATELKLDDIQVYNLVDYDVPEPVIPDGADDYIIGMNICSLWVNGDHYGWACVSPYDDITPVLGYYDEGLPETADWENKFMAEHGIDFQAFCWYANQSKAPMKSTGLGDQLDDAYMHSKYGDKVSFCLLWEASNASRPTDSDAFRNYYVPYWMENYFSDPRYMAIDNKLVFGIFGVEKLINEFGESLKDEFDYMREQVKTLGYDGMIITASNTGVNTLAQYGIDAWNAYNWGTSGYSYDVNVSSNLNRAKNKDVYVIPVVSVGFNSIGWHGTRYPIMSVSDFKKTHEWVRDTYLPTYASDSDWTHNFVWLSTWNEYGEGTYIMPSEGLNGFGYLDALREVYTNGGDHTDVVPTAEQKTHINHLYPQDRRLLRAYGDYTVPKTTPRTATECDFTVDGAYSDYITLGNMTGENATTDKNGTTFTTSSTNPDANLYFKESLYSGLYCEQLESIRVIARIPAGKSMQLFFKTSSSGNWSEGNSARITSTTDDEAVYTFDLSSNVNWTGKITGLRLDPLDATDTKFTVKSITLYTIPAYMFTVKNAYKNYVTLSDFSSLGISTSDSGTTFKSSLTSDDPIMAIKSSLYSNYTCDQIDSIRVVASGIPVGQNMQLFYQTDGAPDLCEANSIRIASTTTDETVFNFKVSAVNGWTGKINYLRLDPLALKNTSFTIKSITFVPSADSELYINNYKVENVIRSQTDANGTCFFPFEPGKSCINFLLYTYHEWDYNDKTLKLYRDGKCVTFTVGSDVADIDGTDYKLPGKVYQIDNIPMLPLQSLADIFGFTYKKIGRDYYFTTPEADLFEEYFEEEDTTPGEWNFNVLGSQNGWTTYNNVSYGIGTLNLSIYDASKPDPMMWSPKELGLSCEDYSKIEIRCRWSTDIDSNVLGFYFITTDDENWNQAKYVGNNVAKTSNDEFVTLTINMASNGYWKGTLEQLRFDPFNANGIIEIDYIKLIP